MMKFVHGFNRGYQPLLIRLSINGSWQLRNLFKSFYQYYLRLMKLILRLLVIAAISFILAQVLPGVHVETYITAIWFAVVLGLLNVFLKPVLILFTLPLTLITFGLFLFVINTIIVLLASDWVKGFKIDSFGWGLLFSLLLTLITSMLFREEDRQRRGQ